MGGKREKPTENSKSGSSGFDDNHDILMMSHISNESSLSEELAVRVSDRFDHQVALESKLKILKIGQNR